MNDSLHPEHQDLLQFLYQFPGGIIAMNEEGDVSLMNPAASQLLSTEIEPDESLVAPLPILKRLAPELIDKLTTNPDQTGMISTGRGQIVDCRNSTVRMSVSAHRLRRDNIVVTLVDVSEERRILDEQRERALRLQRALLGSTDPTDLELSVAYIPANKQDLSGGDWYDVIRIDDDRVALVVGDVVGHDIEASATMGQLRAIVRAFALIDATPSSVLERTNAIANTIADARCASVHYAVIDQAESTVAYASAGHPPPLLIRRDGTSELLNEGRQPVLTIGQKAETRTATRQLAPGDIMLLYTDGLIERRSEGLDAGFRRLQQAVGELRSTRSLDDLIGHLTHAMLADTDHLDDVCILAVRHSER